MDMRNGQSNTNKSQRPVQIPQQQSAPPVRKEPQMPVRGDSHKRMWITIGTLVVLALIVAAVIVMWFSRPVGGDMSIQRDKYQAVFLTNGQVYFGKLGNTGGDYLQLKDVYYLQVQQDVQGTSEGEQAAQDTAQASDSQVSLAKLGGELHGPENVMQINRDQVLFWENLTDNSKVVGAIKQHAGQ